MFGLTRATFASVLCVGTQAAFSDWVTFADGKYQLEEIKIETQTRYNTTMIKIEANLEFDEPAMDNVVKKPKKPVEEMNEEELKFYEQNKEVKYHDDDGNEITEDESRKLSNDKRKREKKHRGPIYMLHGHFGSADSWIQHSENLSKSLPFLLADFGYEVYVGNTRGAIGYTSHAEFDRSDKRFWDFDHQIASIDDLSTCFSYIKGNAHNPENVGISFVGVESGAQAMLYTLAQFEKFLFSFLHRVVLMNPATHYALEGPHFLDEVMTQIKELDPPYVGGPDWAERRAKICDDRAENTELCAHPFMQANELTLQNPMPVREWELLSQNAEAETWQEFIQRRDHTKVGQKGDKLKLRSIHKTVSFILHPSESKYVSEKEARHTSMELMENLGFFVNGGFDWEDYYGRADEYFGQMKMAANFKAPTLKTPEMQAEEKRLKEEKAAAEAAEKAALEADAPADDGAQADTPADGGAQAEAEQVHTDEL